MAKKKNATLKEEDYIFIENNYLKLSDKEIAEVIKCSVANVRRIRGKFNLKKNGSIKFDGQQEDMVGTKIARQTKNDITSVGIVNEIAVDNMNQEQLKSICEKLFKNSSEFKILEKQYTEEEIKYYLEKFITAITEIRVQGEELSSVEITNMQHLIGSEIEYVRLVSRQKIVEREIEKLNNRYSSLEDLEKAELGALEERLKDILRSIKDTSDRMIRIQSSLSMDRKTRLERQSSATEGVFLIIQEMQDEKKAKQLDKQAALLKKSMDKVKVEWEEKGLIQTAEIKDKENENAKI